MNIYTCLQNKYFKSYKTKSNISPLRGLNISSIIIIIIDGRMEWVLHKHFLANCQDKIEQYFAMHWYLDRAGNLQVPWEHRCVQCNDLLPNADELNRHVVTKHTFPVAPGTSAYRKAECNVQQRFQESLPKVRLLRGHAVFNKFKARCVGMTFTATGDDLDHVRSRLTQASVVFGQCSPRKGNERALRKEEMRRELRGRLDDSTISRQPQRPQDNSTCTLTALPK